MHAAGWYVCDSVVCIALLTYARHILFALLRVVINKLGFEGPDIIFEMGLGI